MDQGVALVIATALATLVYTVLALVNFRRGRNGVGAARLFAAVLFAGVTVYLAVFALKLF
jgi:hypothetical protein